MLQKIPLLHIPKLGAPLKIAVFYRNFKGELIISIGYIRNEFLVDKILYNGKKCGYKIFKIVVLNDPRNPKNKGRDLL